MLSGFLKLFMPKSAQEAADVTPDGKLERARERLRQGQPGMAQALCEEILQAHPDHVDTLNLLGGMAARQRDFTGAIRYFDRAIALAPRSAPAYSNKGLALKELGEREAALASFRLATELNAGDAVAHYGTGCIHMELGRLDDALAAFDSAIHANSSFTEAYANRGLILQHLHRFDEAIADYDQAIARSPGQAPPHLHRGNALKELRRLDEALASYARAIDIAPDYAEALSNRGVVLYELGRIDEALDSYGRAIAAKPTYADAHFNRASLLRMAKEYEAAVAEYEIVEKLAPDIKFLSGALLETKMQLCDWSNFDEAITRLAEGIERGEPRIHPWAFLTLLDSPHLQKKAAEIWVREMCPIDDFLGPLPPRASPEKIRVGYFSGDFREHPTSRLIAELIETHDRNRFEITAFSFGIDTSDASRKRLERAFDRFIDVQSRSDVEIAALARSLNIDIAIDLCGYIHGSRPRIFALRAAPVQVNYLGYPGTMGAHYIDYVIADRALIPPGTECQFVEKVIYLPDSYQVNDTKRTISDVTASREEYGLPAQGFVFCCFNNNYKIQAGTFLLWMRILDQVKDSVLWLLQDSESAADSLRQSARAAGISPERLIFGKRMAPPEHLARHRQADLFLDTLSCNAHTTASDALWMGLPVLTCPGDAFASRVAASLLTAIDMPELIAPTPDRYVELAVELGTNPQRLALLKTKLADHRLTRPLFDVRRYAGNLESAFTAIHDRHRAGLQPDHIYVDSRPARS